MARHNHSTFERIFEHITYSEEKRFFELMNMTSPELRERYIQLKEKSKGRTLLQEAVAHNASMEIIQYLLEQKSSVQELTDKRETLFHLLFQPQNIGAVSAVKINLLLSAGPLPQSFIVSVILMGMGKNLVKLGGNATSIAPVELGSIEEHLQNFDLILNQHTSDPVVLDYLAESILKECLIWSLRPTAQKLGEYIVQHNFASQKTLERMLMFAIEFDTPTGFELILNNTQATFSFESLVQKSRLPLGSEGFISYKNILEAVQNKRIIEKELITAPGTKSFFKI